MKLHKSTGCVKVTIDLKWLFFYRFYLCEWNVAGVLEIRIETKILWHFTLKLSNKYVIFKLNNHKYA